MKETKPVYILAICIGHNATASLLKDGEIIACVSEERFTGIKNYLGFPKKSIDYCLKFAGIKSQDLTQVVLPYQIDVPIYVAEGKSESINMQILSFGYKIFYPVRKFWGKIIFGKKYLELPGKLIYALGQKTIGSYSLKKQKNFIAKFLGIPVEKIISYDHHLCHAASAYYASSFNQEKALVFTIDGEGDGLCSTVWIFNGYRIKCLAKTSRGNSLGNLYRLITKYLGMKQNEHEHKVMGLAPYAKLSDVKKLYSKLKDIITLDSKNKLQFKAAFNTSDADYYFKKELEGFRFDNIAGAMQMLLENLLQEWIAYAIKKTGITTVLCSGGIFMNVKANQKVMQLPQVKKAFFMPSAGDESTSIGACYLSYINFLEQQGKAIQIKPLDNLYLGPSFTNNEIEKFLQSGKYYKKYKIEKIANIERVIAELITQNHVVARLAGRMEFGARALGNRSILANPSNMENVRIINEQMKNRDFWMPFAPTILAERADDYCVNPKKIDASFMIVCFNATEMARNELKATIHPYDFTLRPQLLKEEVNPKCYKLIKAFEQLTGVGAVLNTSFNLHGYPIVLGPKEAIHAFENSGIQYLALENFLIHKKFIDQDLIC